MKILVVNAYVRQNAGDAALLSVLLRQLDEAFPGSQRRIAGMEDPARYPEFEGVSNVGSVRRWTSQEHSSAPVRLARKALAALLHVLWFRGWRRHWDAATMLLPRGVRGELTALAEADLVVSLGGGYLNGRDDLGGDLNVFFLLLPVVLAERLDKPVVFAPQSYGPFGNHRQRRAACRALGRASGVFVREDTSMGILREIGVPAAKLERAVDAGFCFRGPGRAPWRTRLGATEGETLVGITARAWLDPDGQAAYERALAGLVDHVHEAHQSFRCVLIPQVASPYQQDDDRIVERRIAALCRGPRPPIVLDQVVSPGELKDLYGALGYLVGTRFHSVIFALTSGVPCLAVEYEHKTGGIMRELDLAQWVVPIDQVSGPDLVARFEDLAAKREDYCRHLGEVLPVYVARADAFAGRLQQVYESGARPGAVPALSGWNP